MEPTPKALALAPVDPRDPRSNARRCAASTCRSIRRPRAHIQFLRGRRGLIKLLPPLVTVLLTEAPQVRLRAMQLDAQHLNSWLESGTVDFAMGSFPALIKGIRRQRLWTERYVSVARHGHPRIGNTPALAAFAAEKHVLVSTLGTGHAHQQAERAIEAAVPAENIICRVPLFTAAAVIAQHSDVIATLPASVATTSRTIWGSRSSTRRSNCRRSRSFSIGTSGFTATRAMRGFGGCSRGCFAGRRRGSGRIARNFLKIISLRSLRFAL